MEDILLAKQELTQKRTIVLVKQKTIYYSNEHGINPMLEFIARGCDLTNFVVADKVVGKGAAILFIYAKVIEVYARVISKLALDILEKHHIKVSYDTLVPNIINRKGTDLCPMEKAVLDVDDIDLGYNILVNKNMQLRQQGGK